MSLIREMPRYKSEKEVWALKIRSIDTLFHECKGAVITPAEDGYAPFEVSDEYMKKHQPELGGYYVRYRGRHESYLPGGVFEQWYKRIPPSTGEGEGT